MKVLVTGSNGVVGSALKSLYGKYDNWIFAERTDCDLTNRQDTFDFFETINPDYVIHLGAVVPGFYNINKVYSFADNVRINENVLEASNILDVEHGLFCFSVNMFPEVPSKFPMDESMIFDGKLNGVFAGYSYAKRMLAMQCQNYNEQYGRKYFGIIPSNIYGPNDNFNSGRLIPNLILKFKEAIKNDSDVIINGTGNPLRQFIYSIDLAKIIKELVLNYNDTKPIICCSDEEISIKDLANKIAEILDFKHSIIFDCDKPDGVFKKTMDNSYLKTIIVKDFSFTPLEMGLKNILI